MGGKGQSCWSTFRPRAKTRCTWRAINGALVRVQKGCCFFKKEEETWRCPRGIEALARKVTQILNTGWNGLRHCCALDPPVVERPLQPGVMRTPGKPWRAGQPDRARQTRTRAKLSRDESGRQLRGTDRGRAAGQQRRGG